MIIMYHAALECNKSKIWEFKKFMDYSFLSAVSLKIIFFSPEQSNQKLPQNLQKLTAMVHHWLNL